MAYNPEEIKARLSGVPVFAVINKKDEFVLIAGEAVSCGLNTSSQGCMVWHGSLRSAKKRCPASCRGRDACCGHGAAVVMLLLTMMLVPGL